MAEVSTFTNGNIPQIREAVQTGGEGTDSCKLSSVVSENSNVMSQEADGKLGDETARITQENIPENTEAGTEEGSSCNAQLPLQNGEVEQTQQSLDESTVPADLHQCSAENVFNHVVGNEAKVLSESSGMEMDLSNHSQLPDRVNQVCDANTPTNTPLDTAKCTSSNLKGNDYLIEQITAAFRQFRETAQDKQQGSGSSLPVTASTANSTASSPYFTSPGNKTEVQLPPVAVVPHGASIAEVSFAQNTACGLPNATGSLTTSSLTRTSSPFIISLYQNRELMPTVTAPVTKVVTQTTACSSSTTFVPVSSMALVGLPKIPVPFPKLVIQKDEPISSSSAGKSQSLAPTSLTLSTPVTLNPSAVSATNSVVVNSVIPGAISSLLYKTEKPLLNVVLSAGTTISSTTSVSVTTSSTMCTEIPAAFNSLGTEATVSLASNNGTASAEMSSPAFTKDAASVIQTVTADNSNFNPEIQTIFSNFTPCSKCNSLLVCSCPEPSSSGQGSSAVSATCSASCQGTCTCDAMTGDQTNALNPGAPDVKPQIFPVVPMNRLDQLFDSLVEYDKVAKAEQPEAITTRLFPYQLQALNWMMTRENNTDLAPFWTQVNKSTWLNKGTNFSTDRKPNSPKGGILADDMGLGKTLTVITLIMANHLNGQPMFSRKSSSHKRAASTSSPKCKAEPVEKMPRMDSNDGNDNGDVTMDDKEAVKKVTIKKKKDVIDKKKRLADSKTLKQPGFKFRQMYLSKFSSKSVKKEKCKEHKEAAKPNTPPPCVNIDDDNLGVTVEPWLSAGSSDSKGPKGSSNSRSSSDEEHGATLIVCPLSVLSNWTDQICSHVHPDVSLQVYMYYGAERLRDVKFLRQQDIVLTTYPTLTNDYARNDSPLHKIKWLRVILDEGHTIRNPQTRLTKAMTDLAAMRRWVLTGTPIQNRLDDLWSVVKFLRLEPFDDKSWWNSALASSVRRGCQQAVNRLQKLLKHISIRRLKSDQDEGKPLVKLPPRTVVIQEVELSEEERKLYDAMQNHGKLIIGRYLRDGMVLKKYAHCFAILMRLRQLCLHPSLCAKESESLQHAQNLLQGLDDSDDDDLDADHDTQRLINDLLVTLSSGVDEECSVCLDSLVEPVITRCAHVFCQQCIMDVITSDNFAPNCPLCRAPVNENELIKVPEKKKKKPTEAEKPTEESGECNKTSSKLEALVKALCAIRDKDPSTKSLVVSQFTSFLDIIEGALKQQDFLFVRLDGRMAQEARARAIETFSDPSSSSPTVFLLSLTAGGVGLNLTAASRVFLLDPAWNPAVEEQCFDRSHRLGQTQEVIITKYIVTNSVEERMLTLQDQKRELMGQAFGLEAQSQEDRRRARVRDIKHLIGL